jgi:hypothetical protein
VLARSAVPDLFEDETIPGKAIVLKMPDRCMKTYFIPLPIDLEVCPHITQTKRTRALSDGR